MASACDEPRLPTTQALLRFQGDDTVWILDGAGRSMFLLVARSGKLQAFVPQRDRQDRDTLLVTQDPNGFRPKSKWEMDYLLARELAFKEIGDTFQETRDRVRLHSLIDHIRRKEEEKEIKNFLL